MCFSDEEQIEVHSDINGKITDYDILKNVPTIDGVPVHGDITESGKYTDETPTAGSKKLITSGAMRAAMERGDLQGPKGDDGYSPRIEVVNIGSGYRVNITDADGTHYFDVICGENAPGTHTHDERYYTEAETDGLISRVQNNATLLISDLSAQTDEKLSAKSDAGHAHDDRYYTESEVDDIIENVKTDLQNSTPIIYKLTADVNSGFALGFDNANQSVQSLFEDFHNGKNIKVLLRMSDSNFYVEADVLPLHDSFQIQYIDTKGGTDIYPYTWRYEAAFGTIPYEADGIANLSTLMGYIVALETQTETKFSGKSDADHTHDDRYYTETETDELISQAQTATQLLVSDLSEQTEVKLSEKSDKAHIHDDRYYTESEVDAFLADKSDTNHTHDDRYYTSEEIVTLLTPLYNDTLNAYNLTWYPDQDNTLVFEEGQTADKLLVELRECKKITIRIKRSDSYLCLKARASLTSSINDYMIQTWLGQGDIEVHTWRYSAGGSQGLVYSSYSVNDTVNDFMEQLATAFQDVVIEQGTSGIWNYRKWLSGNAELWGTLLDTTSSYSAGSQVMKPLELPFALKSIKSFPSLRTCVDSIKYLNHVTTDGDMASKVQFYTEKTIPEGSELRIDFYVTGTTYQ